MPSWHDDDCDCADCRADEDRFWREQGDGRRGDEQMPPAPDDFDVEVSVEVNEIDDAQEDDITW